MQRDVDALIQLLHLFIYQGHICYERQQMLTFPSVYTKPSKRTIKIKNNDIYKQ